MKQIKKTILPYLIAFFLLVNCIFVSDVNNRAAAAGKGLLVPEDFKYLGAFRLPSAVPNGGDPAFGKGLTHRYVNGELRLFSSTWGPVHIYEVKAPTPSNTSSLPTASVVRNWGEVWYQKTTTGSGNPVRLWGLYWDEADKRLYVSHGSDYNSVAPQDPSIVYLTLNDNTGAATATGPWNFTNRITQYVMGCVLSVPQWFADTHLGGKRLAAGCGGPFSGALDFMSYGPALTAFAPPNQSERTSLANTPMIGYTQSKGGLPVYSSSIPRVHRDTDYNAGAAGSWGGVWNPQNGIGYWTAGDLLWQGAVWIDLPAKHGVLFFPYLGAGKIWYETNGMYLKTERAHHAWFVYDPMDLAAVAQGQKQQGAIQPKNWPWKYPTLAYPLAGWGPEPGNVVTGATYDNAARRLYISVRWGAVYVYEVLDSSNSSTPEAPTKLRLP